MKSIISSCSLLLVLAAPISCGDQPQPRVPAPPAPRTSEAAPTTTPPAGDMESTTTTAGSDPASWVVSGPTDDSSIARCAGLQFDKPALWGWITPTMRFRTLQYTVPGQDGEPAADLIFSVFGSGDGGPVDANIDRWAGQFRGLDGTPPREERSTIEVDGMTVKRIELEGSYAGMGAAAPRPGWAQLGVIIQAPGRNVYIRLLGPSPTVLANKDAFDSLVRSARPDA